MSKSLDIGSYPATYLQLADAFERGAVRKTLQFKTRAAMLAARLDLYGFIRAMKADAGATNYPRFIRARLFAAAKAPWRLRLIHADKTTPFEVVR